MRRGWRLRALLISAVVLIAALMLWLLWLDGAFLPGWIEWHTRELATADGRTVSLSDKRISLSDGSFTGRGQWRVQDALLCDLDKDGADELVMLLWKRGRYGPYRPFWVERDEQSWSQHIFIYRIRDGGGAAPMWGSSYTGIDTAQIRVFEKGEALLAITDTRGSESIWGWEGFGLVRMDQ